jgi:iron complex transport system ATP-binding protein
MLEAACLSVSFGKKLLFKDLSLKISDGSILSIIGPNGSGKSTLLKVLSRNIQPELGAILLDGKKLQSYGIAQLAKYMAVLPQSPTAPGDLTVYDLVSYGRFPHQSWWKNTHDEDNHSVEWALNKTKLCQLSERLVSTLSGGERQRVWLAMALAQKPRVLLLDEPTTYLDISHQLEVLELIAELNKSEGITVIMVLHDMNHAARYSDNIAVLNKGGLYAMGAPQEVMNETMLREVFGVTADIYRDQEQRPVCIARCLATREDKND